MPPEHFRACEPHHRLHAFPVGCLITMDRTVRASRFGIAKRAPVQPFIRIRAQLAALGAKFRRGAMLGVTIAVDHGVNQCTFLFERPTAITNSLNPLHMAATLRHQPPAVFDLDQSFPCKIALFALPFSWSRL